MVLRVAVLSWAGVDLLPTVAPLLHTSTSAATFSIFITPPPEEFRIVVGCEGDSECLVPVRLLLGVASTLRAKLEGATAVGSEQSPIRQSIEARPGSLAARTVDGTDGTSRAVSEHVSPVSRADGDGRWMMGRSAGYSKRDGRSTAGGSTNFGFDILLQQKHIREHTCIEFDRW